MDLQTNHYKDLLNRFDIHIISTKSIKTGNHYTGQVKDFLIYVEQHGTLKLEKVNTPFMINYFNHLITRSKKKGAGVLSPRTVNDNLSTLRLFSLRLQDEGIIRRGIPVPENILIETNKENDFALVRQILTIDELKQVVHHCINITEKAIIALAYGSGLRRGELVNLKENQIDFHKGMVTITNSKNNKIRQVPISDYFLKVLRDYSLYRLNILSDAGRREQHFFIDHRGKPLKGDPMNKLLAMIILRTNNHEIIKKNITLHCLRHSIATHLMDAGESYNYVQTFLGHSIADTTLIYAKRRKLKTYYEL